MNIICPRCKQEYSVEESLIGLKASCERCKLKFIIQTKENILLDYLKQENKKLKDNITQLIAEVQSLKDQIGNFYNKEDFNNFLDQYDKIIVDMIEEKFLLKKPDYDLKNKIFDAVKDEEIVDRGDLLFWLFKNGNYLLTHGAFYAVSKIETDFICKVTDLLKAMPAKEPKEECITSRQFKIISNFNIPKTNSYDFLNIGKKQAAFLIQNFIELKKKNFADKINVKLLDEKEILAYQFDCAKQMKGIRDEKKIV